MYLSSCTTLGDGGGKTQAWHWTQQAPEAPCAAQVALILWATHQDGGSLLWQVRLASGSEVQRGVCRLYMRWLHDMHCFGCARCTASASYAALLLAGEAR